MSSLNFSKDVTVTLNPKTDVLLLGWMDEKVMGTEQTLWDGDKWFFKNKAI